MIAYVKGTLTGVEQDACTVETGGIGYLLYCPRSTAGELQELRETGRREVLLYTRTIHREDTLDLYGFLSPSERGFFDLLLTVSGIGPRQALKIMSAGETARIAAAVAAGDTGLLRSVAGIGDKKARQIVLELQEKLKKTFPVSGAPAGVATGSDEALDALLSLGFTEREAREALERARSEEPGEEGGPEVSRLVELALRYLSR
ncbi:MAG: Holliday junction branch migration protein RuvA [Spirochaetota bacterium]